MAVLQSLLAGFRNSRSQTRKSRRNLQRATTTEALEERLLLTNIPDFLISRPGAPDLVYLDFDGHGSTQAFSMDAQHDGTFSNLELEKIEEIFLRVSEDLAPFDIEVRAADLVDPNLSFQNGNALRVVIGANDTDITATLDEWSGAAAENVVTVGDGGGADSITTNYQDLGRDIAYRASRAIGRAVGLTFVGTSPAIRRVDNAPLFATGERDIWSDNGGQDDLSIITKTANSIVFAADDHGNSIATATNVATTANIESIRGVIERNDDTDVFTFSTAAAGTATININVLDLTTRASAITGNSFGAANPGANLDPVLRIFDANGTLVAEDDPANSLSASISTSLAAGRYFIEVSNRGEYGNLGEYTITMDGIDTGSALPVAPQQSNPSAPVNLFLDFNGHVVSNPEVLAQRADGIDRPFYVPVYDTDGDRTSFSADETAQIQEIWARVAEDFAPFDVNVTTSDPFVYRDREGILVAIGGDGSWQVTPLGTGFAELNTFNSGGDDNNAVVFSDTFTSPKETALEISATIAKSMGIETYIDANTGNRVAGLPAYGPIGGDSVSSLRDVFLQGPGSTAGNPIQDPIGIITNTQNRISFRRDVQGNGFATAAAINVTQGDEVLTGIIEQQDDQDWFTFRTVEATAEISITGLDLTVDSLGNPVPGITNPGANFDPVIRLYRNVADSLVLVNSDGDFPLTPNPNDASPASLKATIVETIPAGQYYISVSNIRDLNTGASEYGNVGQYTITMKGVDGTPAVVSFQPDPTQPRVESISENDNVVVGIGRVDRPQGQPASSSLTVQLQSTDTSELIVPQQVVIPPGQTFLLFDVTAVDDSVLDGDQNVTVQAFVGGKLNSEVRLKVRDHETISATVNPDPVKENAGPGGAVLTVTRSNTDIDAANHWIAAGDSIQERDPSGAVIRTIPVEWPGGTGRPAGEIVHDILVLQDGNVAVYNGTGRVFLSVYNVTLGTWDHFAEPGLSANTSADETVGGLASVGDYIFLTDLESFDGDERGIVRVNTLTGEVVRFADSSVGSRLFYHESNRIVEAHAVTGEIVRTLTPTPTLSTFNTLEAITFDGNNLWALFDRTTSASSLVELQKLNPDTGEILEVHSIPLAGSGFFFSFEEIGMTVLNDLIYFNIPFYSSTFAFNRVIQSYNPANRQFASGLIPVDSLNSIVIGPATGSLKGDGTLGNPDVLLFHGYPGTIGGGFGNNRVYMVNPLTGRVVNSFATGDGASISTFFRSSGIEGMNDVSRDGTVLNQLIYLNVDDPFDPNDNLIRVFDRTGVPVDLDLNTVVIDGVPHDFSGFSPFRNAEIAGGDVPGLVAQELSFRDVSIGINDQLLYGLVENGTQISVYDPETLIFERNIQLDAVVNAISVDEEGHILGGGPNGSVVIFDADGTTIATLDASSLGLANVADVDTNISKEVIISDTNGVVIIGPRDAIFVDDASQFAVDVTVDAKTTFSSFGRHSTLPTGPVIVRLTSDDLTELQVPIEVEIPVGQASVSVPIDVIDDNILDGAQLVTITGTADNYVSDATIVTVTDAEQVGVEIMPSEVAETDGLLPNQIRIFRSDVDGPFTVPESTFGQVTTPVPITDRDVTLSHITLVDQISRVTDVDVSITLQHGFIPDLDVALVSPSGTRVQLFADLGSNETNMTGTIFDDEAATRIRDGVAPYTGRFIPRELLSKFDGEDPSGTWTLEVVDDNVTDVGTLLSWSLDIDTVGISETRVTLISSDPSEATVTTTTVVIPAAREEVYVDLTAIDDSIVDGTQTVTISIDTMNLVGFDPGMDTVDVTDVETLQISLDTLVVSEGDGPNAISGTITRSDSDMSQPLIVTLVSSDTSELAVASPIVIPIGEATASFTIDAIDDFDFDGDQSVTIEASAPGYISTTSDEITVTDQEPRLALTTLTPDVAEDAGTITISLSRLDANDLSQPLTVTLVSSDLTELTVPTTLIIGIGQVSTTFTATIVEDTLLDGPQTVKITAADQNVANPAVNSGTLDIVVEDAEFISITVPAGQNSFLENAGDNVTTGTVSVSSLGHTQPIIVSLTNSDPTEISIPTEVLIPVGATSATFQINAVNDSVIDRDQSVTVTGTSVGYRNGVLNLTVQDHEPPIPVGPESVVEDPTPTISWDPVGGATRYDLWVNDVSRGIVQLFRLDNIPATQTSFTPTQELGVGRYRYWVRAYDDLEQPGFWSDPYDFRIRTRPQMVSPTNQSFVASATFPEISWTTVVDTDRYDLWVNNLSTGESQVIRETNLQTTSFASQANLPGGTYRAWVRASVQDDVYTANNGDVPAFVDGFWSTPITFTVLSSPTNVRPSGATFDRTPTIEWDAVDGAENYYIWITLRNPGETPEVILRDRFVVGTSRTPEMDLENGRYAVWVKAVAADGTESAWSPATEFTVGGRPDIVSPVDESTTSSTPTFLWTSVAGADRYEFWMDRTDVAQSKVVYNDSVQTTSLAITSPLASGTYRVWIRAISEMGERSFWSKPVDITVASSDIKSPAIELPSTSGTLLTNVPVASTPETGDERYEVAPTVSDEMLIPTETVTATEAAEVAGPSTEVADDVVFDAGEVVDAVMADLATSDWWTGESKTTEQEASSPQFAAALGLGLITGGRIRRRQGDRRTDDEG